MGAGAQEASQRPARGELDVEAAWVWLAEPCWMDEMHRDRCSPMLCALGMSHGPR